MPGARHYCEQAGSSERRDAVHTEHIVGGRNHSTTVSTLQKVCDGLNITITEFFASDIFAEIEQEIH